MYFSSRTRKRSGQDLLLSQPTSLLLSLSLFLSQHVFQPLPSWTRTYARIRKREFPVITARRSIRKVLTVIHDGRLKMNFGSIWWENIASLDLWKKGRILGFLDEGRREEKSTARLARRSTFTLLLRIPSWESVNCTTFPPGCLATWSRAS